MRKLSSRVVIAWILVAVAIPIFFACDDGVNESIPDGDTDITDRDEQPSDGDDEISTDGDAEEDAEPPDPFETVWWEIGDPSGVRELLDISDFFANHSELVTEMSTWFDHVVHETAGEESKESSMRAYFGNGNGMAFGFIGSTFPFNMLHELIGPEYQKENDGYFSNMGALLYVDGKLLKWSEEWVWKHRKAHVSMTRTKHKNSDLEIDSITFAPYLADPGEERRCLVQVLNLHNTGTDPIENVAMQFQTFDSYTATGDRYFEQTREGKTMRVTVSEDGWSMFDETDYEPKPAFIGQETNLEAGEERQIVFVFEFTRDGAIPGDGLQALQAMGWESALDQTLENWIAYTDSGMTIETPDRKVNDLLDNLKGTLRAVQAHNGAGVEISLHTNSWQRDVYPPVRTLMKFGYVDNAWAMADYLYKGAAMNGGIGNAISADIVFSDPLPEPDWLADVPFTTDRLKGEGPSFLVLLHLAGWRYTGEIDRLIDRWEYLMHALRGQTITEDGYMYFSGDETYRPQMAINLCLDARYAFEYDAYSAYSGFLFVVAAEELAKFIDAANLDKPDDKAWLLERAAFVRERTDALYWLEEQQRYAPFIYRESLEPEVRPAEAVNTQPIWLDYLKIDDPKAIANIESSIDAIGRENGILLNRCEIAEPLLGYDLSVGLTTGMTVTYYLYNLAKFNLVNAADAFDAAGRYASASGNYYEAGIFEPEGRALCVYYDRIGVVGEEWARYRLWEGAIALEAFMQYLVGFEVDTIAGTADFAPRLIHDSSWIKATRIPYLGHLMNLDYRKTDEGYKLSVNLEDNPADFGLHEFRLRINVPGESIEAVLVDGENMEASEYSVIQAFDGLLEVRMTVPAKQGGFEIIIL